MYASNRLLGLLTLIFVPLIVFPQSPIKHVAILGAGYVGLVSGAGLADVGHMITCVDIDAGKIQSLNQGILPLYEPGMQEIVSRNISAGRLAFSSDINKAIQDAEIVIIAVGTPMSENGEADLSAYRAAAGVIAKNLNGYKVICSKSTVPIGTNKALKVMLEERCAQGSFDIVSNPEFLREGSALDDFFSLNPIVLGSDSEKGLTVMEELYQPLLSRGTELIKTDFNTAETIKYAWNGYSATKITYVNELAHLCNAVQADIATVILGMSYSEKLLPVSALRPGPGIGGSCLPKDTQALLCMSNACGVDLKVVAASIEANKAQKQKVISTLYGLLDNNVRGKTIAILGLSFKANTDDIRYSPAIDAINKLTGDGAIVHACDPKAIENMKRLFPQSGVMKYYNNVDDAVQNADALLLLTDWDMFKKIDLAYVSTIMRQRIIMDARNIWAPTVLREHGFVYGNLGKQR